MVFPRLSPGFISRDHHVYNRRILKVDWRSLGCWCAHSPRLTPHSQGETSAIRSWREEEEEEADQPHSKKVGNCWHCEPDVPHYCALSQCWAGTTEAAGIAGGTVVSPPLLLAGGATREIKGKMALLGLQGPQDPLGPGALLATLGKMAPGEHQAQWVPKEKLDKMARRARVDPQGPSYLLQASGKHRLMVTVPTPGLHGVVWCDVAQGCACAWLSKSRMEKPYELREAGKRAQGHPILQGADGPKGEKGEPASDNLQESLGLDGAKGEKGMSGERGPSGLPGRPGEPGLDGFPGPRGEKGDRSERGEKALGAPWAWQPPPHPISLLAQGERGVPGRKGMKGQKGEPGPPGLDQPCPVGPDGLPVPGCWHKLVFTLPGSQQESWRSCPGPPQLQQWPCALLLPFLLLLHGAGKSKILPLGFAYLRPQLCTRLGACHTFPLNAYGSSHFMHGEGDLGTELEAPGEACRGSETPLECGSSGGVTGGGTSPGGKQQRPGGRGPWCVPRPGPGQH
ncbi:hypothetical protein J1605_023074 [Eschrichtius robustus]|uniref:Uncharacterized protein n=1 Tax=Eschrichtius robustus TaxID=9764 RepID=A0AB34H9U0_ESCRO|nr:hypothetical protein J1605_023074 [Eschrichtius robustus]